MTEKLLTPNQLAENLGVKPFTLLQEYIDKCAKLTKKPATVAQKI